MSNKTRIQLFGSVLIALVGCDFPGSGTEGGEEGTGGSDEGTGGSESTSESTGGLDEGTGGSESTGGDVIPSNELFISEYVEGSSNNKAIELFNNTGATIDLSAYQLQFFFNGQTSAGTTISLSGSIADGDAFVVASNAASDELLALADLTSGGSFFNGDDAIVLSHDGVPVDVFGQIGVDPGTEWGSGDTGAQNNTLRRLADITDGDPNGDDAFDPAIEWAGFGQDVFTDLGSHGVNGGGEPGDVLFIHDVQGDGAASPLLGTSVTVEAVVIADFQSERSGYFIQEENADADTNPLTSEGLFVYNPGGMDVNVGDVVRVTGTVVEYFELTEVNNVTDVQIVGTASLPSRVSLSLPVTSLDEMEAVEGMGVTFPQALHVTEVYRLGRYGEVPLSGSDRLSQGTQIAAPGSAALAVEAQNLLNTIVLDDILTSQNPDPVIYPAPGLSASNTLRGGMTVAGLTGVMDFGFDEYRIQPTQTPNFNQASNPRPAPLSRQGALRIASFNVLNYFNGDGAGGGFPTSRGADTAEEFERQSDKIVSAIVDLNADVIGLMEIENDGFGSQSAIAELVDRINVASLTTYDFIDAGGPIGDDEITVGLLYRTSSVSPVGSPAILDSSVDPDFNDDRNRPPLAQTFSLGGESVTVVVNHLKSKGSSCDGDGDPDAGDGQGNCNLTRLAAAQAIVDWLGTDPTNSNDSDFIIMGDLNSYAQEDPIAAIENAGYTNVLSPNEYSYVFDGRWGTLDYQLVSSSLVSQLVSASPWHINADEPISLDYNTEFKSIGQVTSLYAPTAFRASDHDPVVADFDLD